MDTFRNAKKDVVFCYVPTAAVNAIAAIHSVGADGNCGFRAISHDVYGDQTKWIQVKQDMLSTNKKHQDTLNQSIGADVSGSRERMLARSESTKSPCLDLSERYLWFGTYDCPQIVADTYGRPVIMYSYTENIARETGKLTKHREAQIFFPLTVEKDRLDLDIFQNPITLLYAFSHFRYVDFKRTPAGRLVKFGKPEINFDHVVLRDLFPSICKEDLATYYFKPTEMKFTTRSTSKKNKK